MAGRTAICPATLGNVICLGRLSPPGEAVIPPHAVLANMVTEEDGHVAGHGQREALRREVGAGCHVPG